MKRFLITGMLMTLLFAFTGVTRAAEQDGHSTAVMLQGFHWESHLTYPWWNVIAGKVSDIAASGFTMVWLPPSSDAASDEGYLPRRLYVQDSAYGTQAELQNTIAQLHANGVKAIADIVINHRVGTTGWGDFTDPTWGSDAVCGDDEWTGATGAADTGEGYAAARDIDHTKAYVQTSIIDWMNWLKGTIGYDGWRYDFVKGYSGYYVGVYNDATTPMMSVGEHWDNLDLNNPDANRQQIVDWINSTGGKSAAFDFTTKGLLGQAVAYNEYWRLKDANGKPAGLIGWWPAKAVTFIDNHDTGPSTGGNGGQNLWPFPSDKVMEGYAYILTHPGIPCVYWVHYYDWGLHDAIKQLIKIRKTEGINSDSLVDIKVADSSVYAAIIDSKVAMKIGGGTWSPGTGWTIAASGTGYAVWTNTVSAPSGSVRTVAFIHKETVSGQFIRIRGGHDAGLVPSPYPTMDEAITYNNTINSDTAGVKAADPSLDWNGDSALDWTCAGNGWPSTWGTAKNYATDGYGQDPENDRANIRDGATGADWWKFDVKMNGVVGDWYEFKAFLLNADGSTTWETDIAQAGTPYTTINHWGKKGYITFVEFGSGWVEFEPLY